VLTALATVTPTRVDQLNPAVPPALADLIARLLAKDPADRPPSALAVLEALGNGGAVQIHAPLSAPAVAADDTVALELVELDEKRSRRRWAIAVACDLLVLALLISGLVLLARALHG
jgi:serine/threonine-protein kinase